MRLLIAINLEELEKFIKSLKQIEVVWVVRTQTSLLEKIINKRPDTVILSNNLPGNGDMMELIETITSRDYPVRRIIFLYGDDNEQRKNFINFLISRGVYDYFIGSTLNSSIINNLLFKPKTREDIKNDIFLIKKDILENKNNQTNSGEKTVVIEKQLLGLAVISVGSFDRCSGCTHIAIMMAYYLTKLNKRVAYLEMNDKDDIRTLVDNPPNINKEKICFRFKGIDFYNKAYSIHELNNIDEYNYIILDIGTLRGKDCNGKWEKSPEFSEMLRSNVSILMCNSKPWQLEVLNKLLFSNGDFSEIRESKSWNLFFNFTDDVTFKDISFELHKFKVYNVPYNPVLFNLTDEVSKIFENVLESIQ